MVEVPSAGTMQKAGYRVRNHLCSRDPFRSKLVTVCDPLVALEGRNPRLRSIENKLESPVIRSPKERFGGKVQMKVAEGPDERESFFARNVVPLLSL
jgi:hypothetical protein